jgi:hypothetical protein
MTNGAILHQLPLPIDPASTLPDTLDERGVSEAVYQQYLRDVRAVYDEIGWSHGKDVWIAMLVVFVVTIPFVFRWFSRRNRELERRIAPFNESLRQYGVVGGHHSPPKGPATFRFCVAATS